MSDAVRRAKKLEDYCDDLKRKGEWESLLSETKESTLSKISKQHDEARDQKRSFQKNYLEIKEWVFKANSL